MTPYYEQDGITIYHGECLDVLPTLQKADLVLTDPPYGINRSRGFGEMGSGTWGGKTIQRRSYTDTWDEKRPSPDTLLATIKAGKTVIVWGGNFFADILPLGTHWIVWDKLNTMPTFGDCELAWTNVDRHSVKKVTVQWNGLLGKERIRDHPTQKPEALMNWCLLTYSKPPQVVLDPFMGSGTTLVAAKRLGHTAIGIEREEKYCEIAAQRLQQGALPLLQA